MTRRLFRLLALVAISAVWMFGQGANTSGVVEKVNAGDKQIVLKTDAGEVTVTIAPNGSVRRVPPGETSLQKAQVVDIGEVSAGDRALVPGKPAEGQTTMTARLVVVMSKTDIAKKQASEKADWAKRGVIGTVSAASPDEIAITLHAVGANAAKTLIISPGPNCVIRRYAPDSVKFEDARASTLAEIRTGDQVRALGDKSADGGKLTAEEIVSGSFRTIAATVLSVDAAKHEMRVRDLATKTPVVVKITPESNLKKLPAQMAQMLATRNRGEAGGAPGGRAGVAPEGRGQGRGEGRGMRPAGDLTQMLDRVPPVELADLKNGDAIILLSTVGASPDQLNAITLLAGVEPILTKPGTREMALGAWSLGGGMGGDEGNQ